MRLDFWFIKQHCTGAIRIPTLFADRARTAREVFVERSIRSGFVSNSPSLCYVKRRGSHSSYSSAYACVFEHFLIFAIR